jgi:DNA-binding response OmpR family regulator
MTDIPIRVLVVEDHPALRAQIVAALERAGMRVEEASDGRLGLSLALDDPPDVVVLDLGLPGLDGMAVCERLRAQSTRFIGVLMLTARDALADKLNGFEAGADDYLVKPFASDEMVARVRALAQRGRKPQGAPMRVGELMVDASSRCAKRAGRVLQLPPTAFALLLRLAQAHPRAVTRSDLMATAWPDGAADEHPDALRTHIFALRLHLDKPFERPMLITVHGLGYRLEA